MVAHSSFCPAVSCVDSPHRAGEPPRNSLQNQAIVQVPNLVQALAPDTVTSAGPVPAPYTIADDGSAPVPVPDSNAGAGPKA
jgi:hypothetical protein